MARTLKKGSWFECPACRAPVVRGYSSCTSCGHGAASWKLIQDALAVEGSRDLRYNQEDNPKPKGGPAE